MGGIGKRVRGSIYVHASAVSLLSESSRLLVEKAARLAAPFAWNVARIDAEITIGLLRYDAFEVAPFPCLAAAARVNVETGRVTSTDYSRSENPLVIHRKELLVGDDHPMRSGWADVTKRLEEAGLFAHPERIGRRSTWLERLASAGLERIGIPVE